MSRALLLLIAFTAAAGAETPLVVADAATPPAWLLNPADCLVRDTPHGPAIAREVPRDPYTQPYIEIALPASRQGPWVLEIEHVDQGAGVITAAARADDAAWRNAQTQANYTRLNTGTVRRAWFGFDGPGDRARIGGAPWLRAVRVLPAQDAAAWQARRDSIPAGVAPIVTLSRPISLTTTAGIDVVGGMDTLDASLAAMREFVPLAKVLGFTSIESYVTWKRVEPTAEGAFDFSFYDAITEELARHGMKWFPLLIVGSAYALPEWFLGGPEDHGMVCLEHGESNPVQSIAAPSHRRHVTRVLRAFGAHYEPQGILEGVRLGPSGNYGESQYPAGGNWGVKGQPMHIHIGWWAGDAHAVADYHRFLRDKYGDIARLNAAWQIELDRFEDVPMPLPSHMNVLRQRLDFTQWYTDLMSDWCAWWAEEARAAMPNTPIYQSAGGWGFREAGTDYSAQTQAMAKVAGGIRLTNETDSYEQNFYATRLAATAARHYGVPLGYEPASSHTARGVAGRLYHAAATDAAHWFTYQNNVMNHPYAIQQWLEHLPVLDTRQPTRVEVAVYYPETMNQIDDGAFRHLYAWGFNPRAAAVRRVVDVDYLDERLIRGGFLNGYRALVFAWGNYIEPDVQGHIDTWLRAGGTVFYPSFPRAPLQTVDGDTAVFHAWAAGDTGAGRFLRYLGDMEPPSGYARLVRRHLREMPGLHPHTRAALAAERPEEVFLTVQADGHLLALNYTDDPATVRVPGLDAFEIAPHGIARVSLEGATP